MQLNITDAWTKTNIQQKRKAIRSGNRFNFLKLAQEDGLVMNMQNITCSLKECLCNLYQYWIINLILRKLFERKYIMCWTN